jgi:hypothetical protein
VSSQVAPTARAVPRVVVLVVIALAALLLAPVSPAAEGLDDRSAAARRAPADPDLSRRDCALLGRKWLPGRGCARHQCVPGAVPFKRGRDTEMCRVRGNGNFGYGSTVEFRRCQKLGRRWIAEVNWCASNPRRSVAVIRNAPQCEGNRTVYVTLSETEGRYDMCLRSRLADQIVKLARKDGTTVAGQVARRSRLQCSYRPRSVFTEGRCRKRLSKGPALSEGSLLIGDSIAWRGTDELGPRVRGLSIDGIPSRNLTQLKPRLERYRDDFGAPRGLIVELGTNGTRADFSRSDLARVVGSLPAATVVMFVLPYRGSPADATRRAEFTKQYESWMREIAQGRPATCTADWPGVVAQRPDLLVDGVHLKHAFERFWATWLAREWQRCRTRSS